MTETDEREEREMSRMKRYAETLEEVALLSADERVIFDEARRCGACEEDALDAVAMQAVS